MDGPQPDPTDVPGVGFLTRHRPAVLAVAAGVGAIGAVAFVALVGVTVTRGLGDRSVAVDPVGALAVPAALEVGAAPLAPAPAAAPPTRTSPPPTAAPRTTAPRTTTPRTTAPRTTTPSRTTPRTTPPRATTPAAGGPVSGAVPGSGRIQFGRSYPGNATFYGATGAGNCSFDPTADRMVAAMNAADYENSQACGAFVQVSGPRGTVTVRIVDKCPECAAGDLDLSREAFAAIADPVAGRVRVSWRLLSPAVPGPISFRFKEGSSQWWCGVQIRNHRNPVRTVEAQVDGAWRAMARQDYNYFLAADGRGCGGPLRVTDIYGGRVTSGPVAVRPGAVQAGPAQFGPPTGG